MFPLLDQAGKTPMIETEIWSRVTGISFDGPTFARLLNELVSGAISEELKEELLADCFRDWEASTAGYAAVPYLLQDGYTPRLAWELAWTAGQMLTEGAMRDSPPVPDFLKDRVDEKARLLAIRQLKQGIALADLNLVELIQTVSLIAALHQRFDLADKLERIALIENGVPRDYIDMNYPTAQ